jgi:hypothetical protein
MIFAAKTTASGVIALLVAFTFNLDQQQRTLLSQPQAGWSWPRASTASSAR